MTTFVEFDGVVSGDFEAFCWDVDRPTFCRLTGKAPTDHDRARDHETGGYKDDLYRLYPENLMPLDTDGVKFRFRVEVSPV